MSVPVRDWLRYHGFSAHPFEHWHADQEPGLAGYFVRPAIFDDLMGEVERPRSAVLLAPRGHGKSSQRIQIARLCREETANPALAVELLHYDWLPIDAEPARALELYRRTLSSLTARALWQGLQDDRRRAQLFAGEPRNLLALHAHAAWSATMRAERLPPLQLTAEQLAPLARELEAPTGADAQLLVQIQADEYRQMRLLGLLADLVALAQAAGYRSIYYLVDRVDEEPRSEGDPLAALALVRPLMDLHVLELPGLAFKLFLPDYLRETMRTHGVAQRLGERPPAFELRWSPADLRRVIQRRLEAYSSAGGIGDFAAVRSFGQLCQDVADADQQLSAAAEGSPRQLIRMAQRLIADHCACAKQLTDLIRQETLRATLQRFAAGEPASGATPALHLPYAPSTDATSQAAEEQGEPPVPPLVLDAAGYLWLGDKRQERGLSKLPRKILELLWSRRGQYVTTEEIRVALSPQAQEDDALYKAIQRLRKQIQPGTNNSKDYVDIVEGIGYRLINFG